MSREYIRSIISVGEAPITSSVIFYDNFESLLKWSNSYGLDDYIFELDPTKAHQGNQSLYLETRTTNAAENDYVQALLTTYLLPTKTITFTGHFYITSFTNFRSVQFEFIWYDSVDKHTATLEWLKADKKWYYRDKILGLTAIATPLTALSTATWHRVTIKINFSTRKYVSLEIDGTTIDLSTFLYLTGTDPGAIQFQVFPSVKTDAAAPTKINFDDFSLTEI